MDSYHVVKVLALPNEAKREVVALAALVVLGSMADVENQKEAAKENN